jgi:hypothetical protein
VGFISNTNSDLLNMLSGAAPSAQSPSIASDTSQIPATGTFQELMLLFPSTDVAAAGQRASATPAAEPMFPMTGSELPLMVTPTDLSSLRLFSQDGSLFTVSRSQQPSSPISFSELERLEQAVAELQTVTLYVPPEASLNLANSPTATTETPKSPDLSLEPQFEGMISNAAPQILWRLAQDLQVFPRIATTDPGTADDSRVSLDIVQGMPLDPAGIGQISAAQAAFSNKQVAIKDAATEYQFLGNIRPHQLIEH